MDCHHNETEIDINWCMLNVVYGIVDYVHVNLLTLLPLLQSSVRIFQRYFCSSQENLSFFVCSCVCRAEGPTFRVCVRLIHNFLRDCRINRKISIFLPTLIYRRNLPSPCSLPFCKSLNWLWPLPAPLSAADLQASFTRGNRWHFCSLVLPWSNIKRILNESLRTTLCAVF